LAGEEEGREGARRRHEAADTALAAVEAAEQALDLRAWGGGLRVWGWGSPAPEKNRLPVEGLEG
jgi:hypothetical protein